jgi:hypothetical protein
MGAEKIHSLMRTTRMAAFFAGAVLSYFAPLKLAAQEREPEQSTSGSLWSWLKDGNISASARYRFEAFERDGAPYTAPAYAPTLRLALGYETPQFYGFSVFAQGEAVVVTGPADYSDPTLPSQKRPDRPVILDPRSLELNQGYLRWTHNNSGKKVALTLGRQEMILNDGRFLSISYWRQVHGTFDAVRWDAELPAHFSITYAFINRFYREAGYDATDGKPPMHTHMINAAWQKADRINVALYGLLLDYRSPAQFALSTQTYGLRVGGPYQFNKDWGLLYTAEYAKQKDYGSNPNRVDANYYLGELGLGWRAFGLTTGYALLGGSSATDEITTPLAHPFNGWTDLFFNDPSGGGGNGLEARYLTVNGPLRFLDGALATLTYYDYHSDSPRVHYGSELDLALAYKIRRVSNRWEIGWRFGRYWADRLFTNAVRTSIYTSFTL